MKKIILLVSCIFISFESFGIVDIRSAGYSKTFIDFKTETPGFTLKVERTYNSRSLFNGLFGFGWCSNFETKLEVLPDNSLKVAECGGGVEVFYYPKNRKENIGLQVNLILQAVKKSRTMKNPKSLKQLEKDLVQSQTLRADFMRALKIKGRAKKGEVYYANGKSNEFIVVQNNNYKRHLPNGVSEIFNSKGQLKRAFDKFGNSMDIFWQATSVRVMDNRGNQLQLNLDSRTKKVVSVTFRGKKVASYKHKNENLIRISNSYKEKFSHSYDGFHNLTKTVYPDKTVESLSYNEDKDWVVKFNDRRSCEENYNYAKNPKNPNHYFATVEKKCGRKIVNKSKYEFWNKTLANGSKYLHRARVRVNGRLKTDVVYHPKFGSPVSLLRNGVRTNRTYYANGLLRKKEDPYKIVRYKNYQKQCGKPEWVQLQYKKPNTKKIVKTENIRFKFNNKCLLSLAIKSKDEWLKVKHDNRGRLSYMEDQSRKSILLNWHKTLNQPEVITRPGVGSIRVVYDSNGSVTDVKASENAGPTIITQVSSVFNSFLQTLSPVAEEMVIL